MSNLFNRLLKTGSINTNNHDADSTSISSFDEEGFLCPECHRKFPDTSSLEYHFSRSHSIPNRSASSSFDNSNKTSHTIMEELNMWKEQLLSSEQSRTAMSQDLMQQKQRVSDLEQEMDILKRQLQSSQAKVIAQSQEIVNLKSAKDIYDAQLAIFSDELLNTQGELKQKQQQVDTLCNDLIPRPTNDDVDVLKQELVAVQQRMNDMALEQEQEVQQMRRIIDENFKKLDQIESIWSKNMTVQNAIINEELSNIFEQWSTIKHTTQKIRERKVHLESYLNSMRFDIDKYKTTNEQLQHDLQEQILLNTEIKDGLESQQAQNQTLQFRIDQLNEEIKQNEKMIEQLKEDKNQYIRTQMDSGEDHEQQNLLHLLTAEKDQLEQQIKELRKQLKQIQQEKEQLQEQFDLSKSTAETSINTLEKQIIDLKNEQDQHNARRENEFSEQQAKLEANFIESQNIERQKYEETHLKLHEELEAIKSLSRNQIEQLEGKLKDILDEFEENRKQNEINLSEKEVVIARLTGVIKRSTQKIKDFNQLFEHKLLLSQTSILEILEQCYQESQLNKNQSIEEMNHQQKNYLVLVKSILNSFKIQNEKQVEENELKLDQLKIKAEDRIREVESLLNEETRKSDQISKRLTETLESFEHQKQLATNERNTLNQQLESLQNELESNRSDFECRTKKYDMQINALRENLATLRTELKISQEKLIQLDQVQAENIDLQQRISIKHDEYREILERLTKSDSNNEKLAKQNAELTKKTNDLNSALQELAREYQTLQIHSNTVSQRRWLNDKDVHECMSCSQLFSLTQRKHHCRSCGNIFCERCSSKTAIVAASSKKPQRVCDECYAELT